MLRLEKGLQRCRHESSRDAISRQITKGHNKDNIFTPREGGNASIKLTAGTGSPQPCLPVIYPTKIILVICKEVVIHTKQLAISFVEKLLIPSGIDIYSHLSQPQDSTLMRKNASLLTNKNPLPQSMQLTILKKSSVSTFSHFTSKSYNSVLSYTLNSDTNKIVKIIEQM